MNSKDFSADKAEIPPLAVTPPEPLPHLLSVTPTTRSPSDWSNRRLFGLLWPLVVEQLFIVTMGIADTFMVSSVGEHAISGVSLVDTLNFLIITVFNALATGGAVVASQYIGRQDGKNACGSARQLVYISIIISFVLMVSTMIMCRSMLKLIYGNIADDVMGSAQTYFLITALSYPFLALYTSAAALFRSMGNSKITMRTTVGVNLVNIALNALFIYGFGWGVAGAAFATLIGRFLAAAILTYLLMQNWAYAINLRGILKIKLEPDMIKRILNIGIPSGLESSMFQVGKILVTRIFTIFGTAAIAANAVASAINSIAFMPGSGYGMGLLVIAGQCIGAGDYAGTKKYTKKVMAMAYLTYLFINILIFSFMNQIVGIYNLSPEAYKLTVTFLRIHCITSTLFWCPSFVLPNALKAAGDARYVMLVAAGTMWCVRVCLAFILAFTFRFGPVAVTIAMGADFLFRGIFFVTRWKKGKWMKKRVI